VKALARFDATAIIKEHISAHRNADRCVIDEEGRDMFAEW
jgi:hypothetical protein